MLHFTAIARFTRQEPRRCGRALTGCEFRDF